MSGGLCERPPLRRIDSSIPYTRVKAEEFDDYPTEGSPTLDIDPIAQAAHGEKLPSQPAEMHEVIVHVNLEAMGRPVDFCFDEDSTLDTMLHVVKAFFEQSGYFKPYPLNSLDWTIDLIFGDLSILNMVNLLTYRNEPQTDLLIKDLIYGGEVLEPRIFRLTSPSESGAPGPPIEFKWNGKMKQWIPQSAPGEMLMLDARLAVHEGILYTPFTHARGSLSLTSMKLCYLRSINERLRESVYESGVLSAVVFVGIGEARMAVVKKYGWKKDPGMGMGEILDLDEEKGVCIVRDAVGAERMLKFRSNRVVWVED